MKLKKACLMIVPILLIGAGCSSSSGGTGVSEVTTCTTDTECNSNKTNKYCLTETSECVMCLEDSHCNIANGFTCNLSTNTCSKTTADNENPTDSDIPGEEDKDISQSDIEPTDKDAVPQPDNDTPVSTACKPGDEKECYPSITTGYEIVFGGDSLCKKGKKVCLETGKWSNECGGSVMPAVEDCEKNGIDENCDGKVDNVDDLDGDGYTVCDGDCCESTDCASDPKLVNPGAVEIIGNGVNDDCSDATPDDKAASCDTGLTEAATDPIHYAKAMDICQATTDGGKSWGLISAKFVFPDGDEKSDDLPSHTVPEGAHKIKGLYGSLTTPKLGEKMTYLKTATTTNSGLPDDWFMAHGEKIPNAEGCPDVRMEEEEDYFDANDAVMFELKIRVPSNAFGFSVNTYFYSTEYPKWVCSPFNDIFVMLLDSTYQAPEDKPELANPYDKNLAVYIPVVGGTQYPVGVNLASQIIPYDANGLGLFRHCKDQQVAIANDHPEDFDMKPFDYTGCLEDDGNGNTGIDYLKDTDFANLKGSLYAEDGYGGGTGWLVSRGNVVPGETITLRFAIWNTSDHALPSAVLIDNFQWLSAASKPGTSGGS